MPDCCPEKKLAKMSILITGKNQLIHSLLPDLHKLGHSVSLSLSPRETLFSYASQHPDLLIFAEQDGLVSTFSNIRQVNPEADALFIIDTGAPESFEPLLEFHNVSFLPDSSSKEKCLSLIERFQQRSARKKKTEADARIYDLILQSLPFPAMLICVKDMQTVYSNKAAQEKLPDIKDIQVPFLDDLSENVRNSLFTDIEAYRIHSLKSVPAYDRYWDLTIEQVAPSIFMLLAIDTTEQRQQLQFREEMERIARHDLRSPTATIVGMSRILETEAEMNEEFREIAELLRKTSERMIRQIDTSLTLIRLETGTLEADAYPFNLFTAISAAVGDMNQLIEEKRLKISIMFAGEEIEDECSVVCFGEAALIITMFSNLLKNAAEAAPENSRINIRISEGEKFITTEIHNLGAIPESIRNNFFDRYATYGKKYGTGLGTYSARLIAKASGGDISFTTSEEKGTTLITTILKP